MAHGTESDALTTEVKRIVRQSRREPDAGAKICALGDDAISILCTFAQAEAKRKNVARGILAILWILNTVFRIILYATVPRGSRDIYAAIGSLTLFIGFTGVALVGLFGTRATDILTGLDDVRAVAPLLDAITAYSLQSDVPATIRKSLRRLLPRLQASDAARLLPRHIAVLNAELELCGISRDADKVAFTVVVLKALEQVGDETSLLCVEKLLRLSRNRTVRDAANACLPFLRTSSKLGKHSLLRASDSGSTDLLRAAREPDRVDPNVLLRPTASSE